MLWTVLSRSFSVSTGLSSFNKFSIASFCMRPFFKKFCRLSDDINQRFQDIMEMQFLHQMDFALISVVSLNVIFFFAKTVCSGTFCFPTGIFRLHLDTLPCINSQFCSFVHTFVWYAWMRSFRLAIILDWWNKVSILADLLFSQSMCFENVSSLSVTTPQNIESWAKCEWSHSYTWLPLSQETTFFVFWTFRLTLFRNMFYPKVDAHFFCYGILYFSYLLWFIGLDCNQIVSCWNVVSEGELISLNMIVVEVGADVTGGGGGWPHVLR